MFFLFRLVTFFLLSSLSNIVFSMNTVFSMENGSLKKKTEKENSLYCSQFRVRAGGFEALPRAIRNQIFGQLDSEDFLQFSLTNSAALRLNFPSAQNLRSEVAALQVILVQIRTTSSLRKLSTLISAYYKTAKLLECRSQNTFEARRELQALIGNISIQIATRILDAVGVTASPIEKDEKINLLYKTQKIPNLSYEFSIILHKRASTIDQNSSNRSAQFHFQSEIHTNSGHLLESDLY